MTASDLSTILVPALEQHGFRAARHVQPTPNGYGHKITLSEHNGQMLGVLVIYHGKQGPRYVTNELTQATPEILDRIAQAWASLEMNAASTTPTRRSDRLAPVPAGTIELWVDGACVQEADSLKFGWAFVIQQDGRELTRHASHVIKAYMAVHRNVAAELQAVIHGLTHCRQMGHQTVTVFYDYAGIEQWATGRWKANTRTTQEYVRFIADCPITITWQKVPAHSGIPMNELVDQLATGAAHASNEHHSV
ncbi:MAG: reverse transcriptase-like protein [Nitrospirae bacterium]|nr:reverse transcriptase-like protein [Nitrospirota bacterium]MDE3051538.1 reverse transcriptase-like protein [Nitrospirota bacterium]